ncbi:ribonucleotide-diphosphate reductase subunit alpha [Ectopseudomonas mendocina]|uniref:Ribonucleoside-diphosphate reductase n=1 Tax=Ectopseudomonas mendocina TaxID=300 RepID=A0A379PPW0_ECTME|nr:ribonucleoside-diphosphate reductase subunit alpha [Pseudomonas mendocina]SUE95858.1 ribonucleotide-diphosphate reductase subunit alpha [Pseudomonas mendocina]
MHVVKANGELKPFDPTKIQAHTKWACEGLNVSQSELEASLNIQFYDGMSTKEIADALIMTASSLISAEQPDFDFVTARLTLQSLYKEVTGGDIEYPSLISYLSKGRSFDQIDERLVDGRFNLSALNSAIKPERDFQFTYQGIRTLADRYLLKEPAQVGKRKKVYELPQHFLMRVAMGCSLNEKDPTHWAIEFYNLLSTFDYMSSTPTLFNAATKYPQLSSCYGGLVPDDLELIFDLGFKQNAMLSKFAGGIGSSWTPVRAAGSVIKSTNGESAGVVPFLKIFNDVAVAVNQGGKRKGAFAPYLEMWHSDIYEFCDLKLKTGDEHIRTHDIFPAAWIPDLFMERLDEGGDWSLFCPNDVPELHETFGAEFKRIYEQAEADGKARKVVKAEHLWRYLLDKLFRTGNPWITFKDECNRRNPQQHDGMIHNSNLCTEITLNNSKDEVFVCNLGSINLANHVTTNGKIDSKKLRKTVRTAVRMLDNVIDINYYPTEETRRSNLRHRPIGLGVMGYQEAMVQCDIDWDSQAHLDWADRTFEEICFYATDASADLAIERGAYQSFKGSTWSKGLLTIDHARDKTCNVFSKSEWDVLREKVKQTGIRNSNITSIAPTATISNIIGTTPCIEPINERETVKENLSGTFVQVSPLRKHGKLHLEKTVWEVDQDWSIDAAIRRQKWIDQSQSLNIYRRKEFSGRHLDAWYRRAWRGGVKTTYYLRNQTSTADDSAKSNILKTTQTPAPAVEGFECEACQ